MRCGAQHFMHQPAARTTHRKACVHHHEPLPRTTVSQSPAFYKYVKVYRCEAARLPQAVLSELKRQQQHHQYHAPTLQQYDDFELLWLEYRHELSISKTAAVWALQDVQLGLLPCDADLLRHRALQFTALGQQRIRSRGSCSIDSRRILNSSRHILAYDDSRLQDSFERLLQLLPAVHPTQLLLDTAADLDLPPELLALQYQELGMAFEASLGSHVTAKPLHHLLQHLRGSITGTQHQQQQQGNLSAFQQVLQTSAGLKNQLQGLAGLLGPEVAHAALQETPQLLDVPLDRAQANLRWLQRQLGLSPVAAMLLAGSCGQLLLLPEEQLVANYGSLRYLLQQLLGWRQQQLHSAVYNVPQLLVAQPQQCAAAWQRVQQLARRRLAWLRELSAAEAPLVTSVLGAQRMQLAMLQYVADTGDVGSKGLGQVLQMQYVDFVAACPGFRTWRDMAPGRWKFEAVAVDGMGRTSWSGAEGEGAAVAAAAAAIGAKVGTPGVQGAGWRGTDSASNSALERRVLTEDASGQPVLVAVGGPLGPFDRLA